MSGSCSTSSPCGDTSAETTTPSCCSTSPGGDAQPISLAVRRPPSTPAAPWMDGFVSTAVGEIPRIRTPLALADHIGTLRVRLAYGRDSYTVAPGLYAVGSPTPDSPVLVTANYKLTFDHLRSRLAGRDLFILVLDTKGINVWCAAGKGTFGTDELVRRIREAGLSRVVSHRTVVLPQLGAPGVAAHLVRLASGFAVRYGPVRAADLPAFLDARMKATDQMRRVHFGLRDRMVLAPVEIVLSTKKAALVALVLALLSGLRPGGYSLHGLVSRGPSNAALFFGAFLAIGVLGPMLLPWLPGRAFAVKGAVLGLGLALVVGFALGFGPLAFVAWAAMLTAASSYVVMNFTGTSTFTSLSGVLFEMRFAVPSQIATGSIGFVMWLLVPFVSGGVR